MSDSREAFEKWWGAHEEWHTTKEHAWQAWQAAQAQAGQPIAVVHGWFHGECVIRALDPEAALPVGMALYSQPQAQAGNQQLLEALKALYDYNPHNCPSCEPTNEELELWQKAKAAIAAAQEQRGSDD